MTGKFIVPALVAAVIATTTVTPVFADHLGGSFDYNVTHGYSSDTDRRNHMHHHHHDGGYDHGDWYDNDRDTYRHHHHHDDGRFIGGLAAGALLGSILSNSSN